MEYKGYELIEAIANGKIKNGTKIIPHYPNNDCNVKYFEYYHGFLNAYYKNGDGSSQNVNICVFLDNNRTFEVIDNEINIENKIDIENIEELATLSLDKNGIVKMLVKIHELIHAVKQLNIRIKKLEENK